MTLAFHKYQGTGNDFIIADNRDGSYTLTNGQVAALCDRRFGIGADGLMLLEDSPGFDFRMVYYNSDGNLSSMCGNGARCLVAYAGRIGLIKKSARFLAPDGPHEAILEDAGFVSLKMNDVKNVESVGDDFYLNTGSPHYVRFVEEISAVDVFNRGREIRNSERFIAEGTNVNFIQVNGDVLHVRTYERGVEDETYSCGTGVTAAALVASLAGVSSRNSCRIMTKGGELEVTFERVLDRAFYNIWLKGPAEMVFHGELQLTESYVSEG